jgi:hypothetical protein
LLAKAQKTTKPIRHRRMACYCSVNAKGPARPQGTPIPGALQACLQKRRKQQSQFAIGEWLDFVASISVLFYNKKAA